MGFSSNLRGLVYVSRGCSYTCMPTMLVCENSRVKYTTEQDLLRMNAYTCTCIYMYIWGVESSTRQLNFFKIS